ncbi:hypothetical protein C3E89_01785 [Clostridium sp. Cult1]|nr:hypothetical protein [Clostridium sp. Cult1]
MIVDEGENLITVKAVDLAGNEMIIERTVFVEIGEPTITNILPNEDVELRAGDTLDISFNAPTGGSGYYRIMLPFGPSSNEPGTPMTEEDGLYTGTWTVPEGLVATDLQVQVIYISEYGNKVSAIASGRITVIGDMKDLAINSIIIDDEAYDMDYLDNNPSAQRKLLEWGSLGYEAFIKIDDDKLVTTDGEFVTIDVLPESVTHYDRDGNITYYTK